MGTGVSYPAAGLQTVTITPTNTNADNVSVTAKFPNGTGCGTGEVTSNIIQITYQLTSANTITISNPGCLTPGELVTLAVSGTSTNTSIQWSLPGGWTPPPSNNNIIMANVGQSGTITARVQGCPGSGTISRVVTVSGNGGCAFTVDDPLTCGQYRVRGVPSATCVGTLFDWTVTNASGTPIATGSTTVNFWKPTAAIPTGSRVSVRVRNSGSCLDAQSSVFTTTFTTDASTQCRSAGVLGTTDSTSGSADMVAYPNPTGSELRVELPAQQKGATKLALLDAAGRRVLSTVTSNKQQLLDVRRLPDGIYTLQATLPNGKVLTQKVVVSR